MDMRQWIVLTSVSKSQRSSATVRKGQQLRPSVVQICQIGIFNVEGSAMRFTVSTGSKGREAGEQSVFVSNYEDRMEYSVTFLPLESCR